MNEGGTRDDCPDDWPTERPINRYPGRPAQARQTRKAGEATAWLLAASISAAQLFYGFDFAGGMAAAGLLAALALMVVATTMPPDHQLGRAMIPLATALLVTIGWGATATVLANGSWPEAATARLLSVLSALLVMLATMLFAARCGGPGVVRLLDRMMVFSVLGFVVALDLIGTGNAALLGARLTTFDHRFAGLLENANAAAAVAGAFAIYAVARLINAVRRHGGDSLTMESALLFFVTLIMVAVVLLAASRLPGVLTLISIWLVLMIGLGLRRGRRVRAPWLALGLAVVAAFAGLWLLIGATLHTRSLHLGEDLDLRQRLWEHLVDLVARRPLTGYGMGMFPEANLHALNSPAMATELWKINSAHNLALQLLLVGGWPYLAGFGVAALLWLRGLLRLLACRPSVELRAIPIMLGNLLAVAAIDITLDFPATVLLFAALAGTVWGLALTCDRVGDGRLPR